MDETTLIKTVQDELDEVLDVPVRTSAMDDERPVPAVILDDWATDDLTVHNKPVSRHRYRDFDGDGNREVERWYNFYYETRIEFVVRHDNQFEGSQLKDTVKTHILDWSQDCQQLHDHLQWVRPISSGDPEYFFGEPKESELNLAIRVRTFHQIKKRGQPDGLDPIEVVEQSFSSENLAQ